MKRYAYSLYDRKTLVYSPPFFCLSDGEATRTVADVANDMSTLVGRHPSDYVLFLVGEYDDARGQLLPTSPLVHVCDVIALTTPSPLARAHSPDGTQPRPVNSNGESL